MITCNIIGGLGNQLFQIFATISYALKHKQVFCFTYKTMTGKRPMYWDNFLSTLKLFTNARMMSNVQIVDEPLYYSVVPNNQHNIMLTGYFQNPAYFKEYYKPICRMIRLDEQKEKIKEIMPDIDFNNSISMHFRQGDYLLFPDHYKILTYEYYKNSLNHILKERRKRRDRKETEEKEVSQVLYFCEDGDLLQVIDIIKQLKEVYPPVEFTRAPSDLEDWQQLLMMSCCQDNIIANSTFSWWGAYFNSNFEKIVCSPAQWFGPKINIKMEELLPEEWIKI
jgi:hypothetical protein